MEISVIVTAQCRREDFVMFATPRLDVSDPLSTFTFQPPEVMPGEEQETPDCIAFSDTSPDRLEEECAREILSLFMLSICMQVKCVKGKTRRKSGGKMTNTIFTGLAKIIVQAGLANSTDQALLYVIPAFAKFKLLPKLKGNELVIPIRERDKEGQVVEKELRFKQADRVQH